MKISAPILMAIAAIAAIFTMLLLMPAVPTGNGVAIAGEIAENVPKVFTMRVSTDKEDYSENEAVKITASIGSPRNVDAEVSFLGVEDRYGGYRISKNESVELLAGDNTIAIEGKMPSCSGCAGVRTGKHMVHARLYVNGTHIINASAIVTLG